jgi:DNA-binding NtrC family response regulator
LARAIHEASPRGGAPFVPVNCAAFPESLLEAELFGYEEGSFTGATSDRRGYFELAHSGTIFLDEIGEVPRYVQVKLLRVLQERTIQRIGSEQEIPIDVRIMAATNRELEQEITSRRFRRDLYYRLSVVTLDVPSLREHPEDIPELLDRYLEEFRVSLRRDVTGFSAGALDALCRYKWPGNIRELINVVERAVLLCEGSEITPDALPPGLGGAALAEPTGHSHHHTDAIGWLPPNWQDLPWPRLRRTVLRGLEREYLVKHLSIARGRIGATAERTGLSTRSLHLMMKRQGLKKEDYRGQPNR